MAVKSSGHSGGPTLASASHHFGAHREAELRFRGTEFSAGGAGSPELPGGHAEAGGPPSLLYSLPRELPKVQAALFYSAPLNAASSEAGREGSRNSSDLAPDPAPRESITND